ncbi:uncharacterized protein BDR25DRAFT_364053 [Lindgomyces ingoldianus]|uniref:Uncharacterized protein n=1 Tax=Lindgomyces ingoldianus TaxID=673940 RepID=A0ACB6Q6P7_9PLEO|nr:uncharacterized protein BDR25DRAFT_364053 [Lindgomyces ingoldianus]KAF2462496.1 hypothetical protein BDR25DRAFT_364053 [Lindgomyces ingoldianus]
MQLKRASGGKILYKIWVAEVTANSGANEAERTKQLWIEMLILSISLVSDMQFKWGLKGGKKRQPQIYNSAFFDQPCMIVLTGASENDEREANNVPSGEDRGATHSLWQIRIKGRDMGWAPTYISDVRMRRMSAAPTNDCPRIVRLPRHRSEAYDLMRLPMPPQNSP